MTQALVSDISMPPADLEAFWARTRGELARVPVEVKVEAAPERVPYQKFRLTYRSLGGVSVRAYLGVPFPAGSVQKPLPAIVTAPGYGGWEFGATLSECLHGYVVLQVYPRGQGESAELWQVGPGAYQAWVNHGKHHPEGFFYQGAFMDFVRGIDYLRTRADVDGARIGFMGASQAGMLALGVSAVDERIKAVVAGMPFACNFRHNPAYLSCKDLTEDEVFLSTFDYFDPVNLAGLIKAPTLVTSGGKDTTCPPAMIRTMWDRLKAVKALYHDPELGHTTETGTYRAGWDWLQLFL